MISIRKSLSEGIKPENLFRKYLIYPDRCGSVGWVLSCKAEGHRLDSRSGHMPGWQVWSPVRVCVRGNQSIFFSHTDVSLSLSLLSPFLKINTLKKTDIMLKSLIVTLGDLWFCQCCHIFFDLGWGFGFNLSDIFYLTLKMCFLFVLSIGLSLFFLCLLLDQSSLPLEAAHCWTAPLQASFTFRMCALAFKNLSQSTSPALPKQY